MAPYVPEPRRLVGVGAHDSRSGGSRGGRHARSCGAGAVRALGGRVRPTGGRLAGATGADGGGGSEPGGADGAWLGGTVGAVAGSSEGGGGLTAWTRRRMMTGPCRREEGW